MYATLNTSIVTFMLEEEQNRQMALAHVEQELELMLLLWSWHFKITLSTRHNPYVLRMDKFYAERIVLCVDTLEKIKNNPIFKGEN